MLNNNGDKYNEGKVHSVRIIRLTGEPDLTFVWGFSLRHGLGAQLSKMKMQKISKRKYIFKGGEPRVESGGG